MVKIKHVDEVERMKKQLTYPGKNLVESLKHTSLSFGGLRLDFQRTCRVPGDAINSLPAGLGPFPVYKVSDFKSGCPAEWQKEGYFFPMYRQEAMWINFSRGYQNTPKALIIGAGNINAISGKPFDSSKDKSLQKKQKRTITESFDIKLEKEQNYLSIPPQPWLDGWKGEDNQVYQFVAAEMGSGQTVEGQITGEEKIGGIQFIIYDPKPGQKLIHATRPHEYMVGGSFDSLGYDSLDSLDEASLDGAIAVNAVMKDAESVLLCSLASSSKSVLQPTGKSSGFRSSRNVRAASAPVVRRVTAMGLGRGGAIEQKIYPDPYGIAVWNEKPSLVEVVYMISSENFKQVTGYAAPPSPITYETYQQYGLPWFELHDQKYKDSKGSDIFAKLKPVADGKVQVK